MSGDTGKNVGQPSLRINPVHFCGDDEAIHGRSASAAAIRSAEQPRFSSKCDASEPSLCSVVGETHASIFKEEREARPSLEDVVERLEQFMRGREFRGLLPHIDPKILDQGPA